MKREVWAFHLHTRAEPLRGVAPIADRGAETPRATAAKTLQVHISRLRKALAAPARSDPAGVIATHAHGYRLEVDPDRLDAHRFERLVAQGREELAAGRPGWAAAVLEEGLSLWRGPPLADVAHERFAQGEVARLDE